MLSMRNQSGFTIPELVVACSVLAAAAVVAGFYMHPRDYSRIDRNAERRLAVAKVMQAIRAYEEENNSLPPSIEAHKRLIGARSNANLCGELVPRYLKSLPSDPLLNQDDISNCTNEDYDTALAISRSADSRSVTVEAPLAEGGAHVTLTYTL